MRRKPKKFAQFLTERINELVKNGRIIPCPDYREPEPKIQVIKAGDEPKISKTTDPFSFNPEDFPHLHLYITETPITLEEALALYDGIHIIKQDLLITEQSSEIERLEPHAIIMCYDGNTPTVIFTEQDFPPLGATPNFPEEQA